MTAVGQATFGGRAAAAESGQGDQFDEMRNNGEGASERTSPAGVSTADYGSLGAR